MEPVTPSFTANVQPETPKKMAGLSLQKVFLGAILFFLLLGIWMYVSSPLLITVTGSGEVSVPATNATLSLTLTANDSSISTAVSSVQSKADAMRTFLKSKGVAEGDIAQSQVGFKQLFQWPPKLKM